MILKFFMVYSRKYYPLFFIVLTFLFACKFTPDGINEVVIEPPSSEPSENLIVKLNFSTDTVYIPEGSITYIEYEAENYDVHYVQIYIDNSLYDTEYTTEGELQLSYFGGLKLNTPYTMQIDFFTSSGTGSLADLLDSERYLFSHDWVVYIVNDQYIGSDILEFENVDQSLKLHWSEFRGVGFQKYNVFLGVADWVIHDTIDQIDQQDITSTFDVSFVGFTRAYYIETVTKYGTYLSPTAYFEDEMPQVYAEYTESTNFLITWEKGKYLNNISGYKVYESLDAYNNEDEIAEINTNTDTSFLYGNGKFGVKTYFYLQPIPLTNPPVIGEPHGIGTYSTNTDAVYLGDLIPSGGIMNTPIGQYCYYSNTTIYKFNCETQSFTDSLEAVGNPVISSPNGEYLIRITVRDMSLYDANDLSLIKEIDIQTITGNDFYSTNYAISDNGIVVFSTDKFYIYDVINENLIGTFDIDDMSDDWSMRLRISPTGEYIMFRYTLTGFTGTNTVLLECQADTAEIIWNEDAYFYQFDYINNNFTYYLNNNLITRSLDNLSVLNQLQIDDQNIYNIDYNNYEFITLNNSSDKMKIYDFNTGSLKYEVFTYDFDGSLYLSNNTIFINGYKRHLEY